MKKTEIDHLAKSWIAFHYAAEESEDYKNNFWAFNSVCDLCQDDPEACWVIIEAIRQIDSNDAILSNLAAGPMEDLLGMHGDLFIDRIEVAASKDPQMKKLIGAIWQNAIPDNVWNRLKSIADPSW